MSLSKKLICQESLLLKASREAAISCSKLIGMGQKNEADDLAVKAMRSILQSSEVGMEVVIGEGEMDEAPMLYIGEQFGKGEILFDIAVDPLEGTNLCANNIPNSITTIAIGAKGTLLKAPDCYMEKIASGLVHEEGVLHIENTIEENIQNLAKYLKKDISEIVVIMLERERHKEKITKIRALGAKVKLISDGDIYGVLATTKLFNQADLYIGSGGAPEGILAACAIKTCKGFMMGKLILEDSSMEKRMNDFGIKNPSAVLTLNEMVKGDCIFVASGVTDGNILEGVKKEKECTKVESIIFKSIEGKNEISKITDFILP